MRPLPRPLLDRLEGTAGPPAPLWVVRLGALGDLARTLPAVWALHRAWPGAGLHWAVDDAWSGLLRGWSPLEAVLPVDRRAFRQALSRPGTAGSALRGLVGGLRRPGAPLALDLHGNLRSGLLTRWTGAAHRIGFGGHQQREGNRRLMTDQAPEGPRRQSRVDRALGLVRALGVQPSSAPLPGLPSIAAARDAGRTALGELGLARGRFVAFVPGSSRRQSYKRPPRPHLARVAARFAQADLPGLVLWGPGEQELAVKLTLDCAGDALLAPPTDLPTLGAILGDAAAVVGGDTGPLHLAAAFGRPVLMLFGPTDPAVNAPLGERSEWIWPRGAVYSGIKRQDRRIGFDGLSPEDAEAAASRLLARGWVRRGEAP